MKRKQTTLIIMSLGSFPILSHADVTLYGEIKGGMNIESNRLYLDGKTSYQSHDGSSNDTIIRDYGSNIGFKGQEDLGNGLKTIWQVEQGVSLDGDANKGWSSNETFIGLAGQFGQIRIGNLKNIFDSSVGITNPWAFDSNAPLSLGLLTRTNQTIPLAVRYDSPDFSGFGATLMYQPAASAKEKRPDNTAKGVDKILAGFNYDAGDFFVNYGYGYLNHSYTDAHHKVRSQHIHRIEGGYHANNWFASAAYQYSQGEHGNNIIKNLNIDPVLLGIPSDSQQGFSRSEAAATLSYTTGNLTPRISYAHGWNVKAVSGDKLSNTHYNQVIAGVDYALSKRSMLFAAAGWQKHGLIYGNTHEKNHLTQKVVGVGMKHTF